MLASIDPNTKLLRDAIQMIPNAGFIQPPEQRKNTLLKKVDELETILKQANTTAAINKLENDIRDKVEKWVVDYAISSPLQPTKQELIRLIDGILKGLHTTI